MAKTKTVGNNYSKQLVVLTDTFGDTDENIYFIGKNKDIISYEERSAEGKLNTPEKGYSLYLFNRLICFLGLRQEYTRVLSQVPEE